MMGGSYGGYMANWIAGHTGRFQAIVSHAGLWALDQMFGTTDAPHFWRREFGAPAHRSGKYADNTPHLHIEQITTPMLVIHGDRDYRVPVGEALRLWSDLKLHGKTGQVPVLPGREPLDTQAGQRHGLVPDSLRVPRPSTCSASEWAQPRPAIA